MLDMPTETGEKETKNGTYSKSPEIVNKLTGNRHTSAWLGNDVEAENSAAENL